MNTEIILVPTQELDGAKLRMMNVRFDCLVKMFDFGQIEHKSSMPFVQSKPLPPQWFKLQANLTMDFIESSNPYDIGIAIKQCFQQLKEHIERYEKSGGGA